MQSAENSMGVKVVWTYI